MKKTHKIISILLVLAMMLTMAPILVFAAETVASGTCGTDVSYVLNSDGVLTVSGSGAMTNYRFAGQVPYYAYLEDIKTVIIEDGVTSVGTYAFRGCTNLTSLEIKGTLDKIGKYAFYGCSSMTEITYLSTTVPDFADGTSTFTASGIKVTVPEGYPIDNFAGLTDLSYTASTGSGETTLPTYAVTIFQRNTGVAVKTVTSDGVVAEEATYGKDLTVELEITGEGTLDEVYVHHIYIGDNRFDLGDEDCPVTLNELTLTIPGEYVTEKIEIDAGIMLKVSVDMAGGYLKNTYSTQWNDPVDGVVTMTKEWARYGVGGMWYFEEDFAREGYILADMIDSEGNSYAPNYQLVLSKDLELTLVWEECTKHNYIDGLCVHCGKADHTHSFKYTAGGSRIVATCVADDCTLENGIGGTLTISAPADLYADGTAAKEVVIDNQLVESVDYSVTYSTADGLAPKTAGTYTASVTVGGATASVEFTLSNYTAKVTDEDGNLIGNYKTLADAVTAAQEIEYSTLTLLDDITVTTFQIINSGNFTIDLNGKTLLSESSFALRIQSGAHVIIKDSGEGGTVESKTDGAEAIINYGGLTVESGTMKGDGGIDNRGFLNFVGGTAEGVTHSAIDNCGSASVHGGVMKSENGDGITNDSGGMLSVYGGEISGRSGIANYDTAFLSGGEFKGNSYAAINLISGTVEITGGSFTGTDDEYGSLSGTPYGELTVDYTEGANLTLKGGEFPNGFTVHNTTANVFLEKGYAFYDANGNKITVSADATNIDGYVQVKEHYIARVTDKDGNLIDSYKTIEDAISAASDNNGSTLVLLDDITVTKEQKIKSGKFTLDLNGKTLLNEIGSVLYIQSDADLTIEDSSEGGAIESQHDACDSIYNEGKLTVESGIVKGDGGIGNYGTLIFNGGTVESVTYEAISNGGTAGIYGGNLKSEKKAGIENRYSATFNIYGGEIDGITNFGTAYISGGEIDRDNYAALNLLEGTVEIMGGSFSGTDLDNGYYSGTPYGEWTVDYKEGATLTLKGGEFPGGFTVYGTTANVFLADGYHFRNEQGKVVDGNSKIIEEKVTVEKGADFSADAVVTAEDVVYNGSAQEPTVTVKVGGKTLIEGKDYTLTFANNINAGTATVTVKAVGQVAGGIVGGGNSNAGNSVESVYTGEITKEFTVFKADSSIDVYPEANELTYNGEAQTLVVIGDSNDGSIVYSLDGEKYSPLAPTGTNAGEYTIYYKVEGDSNHNDSEPETITVTIKAKDISDGFIILGDALTYNGKEQTQTVEKVLTTNNLEATYTVSGNKATNVGVYLLTVTGTGNFTGEAMLTFEIAVDMNGVDFDQLHPLNVKATDRENIEYIYNQLDNAFRDYADAEKRNEWDNNKSYCVELLKMIESVANHIESFENDLAKYDINTVTSDDDADLESFQNSVGYFYDYYFDNLTDEQEKKTSDIFWAIEKLEIRISDVAKKITRITNAVNSYDKATVKSSDKADIEQLIADIKELTDGQNLTADEREYLVNADAKCDKLLAKIAETKSEYDRVIAAANGYDEAMVTSADKDALVQLNDDIYALALTDNVTAEEKENLENAHNKVLALIDKLTAISNEIKRIIEAVDKYVFESVKSSDKADIEQIIADIKALLDTKNITADERALLENADETCTKLIEKVDKTVAEISRINDATNTYDEATVKYSDYKDILQLIDGIKALTDGQNITDDERASLEELNTKANLLAAKIRSTADEISRITRAVNTYNIDTVKSSDKADIENLIARIKKLTDGDNITSDERINLNELNSTLDALLAKIDDTTAEIARIDEAVNSYDMETVTSADIPAFGKLIDDIKALTDGQNITDDEKAALEASDEAIDELVEKLTEVAEEIKRVDEAVKSYDEATVKSTDKADLEQLKEDIQALIDSTNTTENEKTALGGMLEKDNALIDVIDEIEQQIEDIGAFENNFNPENVSSDDKAAIEEKIAEIENVNPDNLTEEQKAEYAEIKADLEALLEEIEKAGSEVDAIGAELEMFDEERVTIFYEDEIEALKAKIDELIADENMGEAEKAKLNEYKAQCDNLIEIINTPAKYFSMRLFYFVWDAVNWLVNCIASIF